MCVTGINVWLESSPYTSVIFISSAWQGIEQHCFLTTLLSLLKNSRSVFQCTWKHLCAPSHPPKLLCNWTGKLWAFPIVQLFHNCVLSCQNLLWSFVNRQRKLRTENCQQFFIDTFKRAILVIWRLKNMCLSMQRGGWNAFLRVHPKWLKIAFCAWFHLFTSTTGLTDKRKPKCYLQQTMNLQKFKSGCSR